MQIPTIVILIALAAIGGYVIGILDSKFTQTLIEKVTAKRDLPPFLSVRLLRDEQFSIQIQGQPINTDGRLPPEQVETIKRIDLALRAITKEGGRNPHKPTTRENPPIAPQPSGPALLAADTNSSTPPTGKFARPLNLVEMINNELLKKSEENGLTIKLRLEMKPDDSISYRVGPESYPSVENIPDPQAREIFKKTLAEWQQTN